MDYLKSEELCNEHGAYLADILDQAESDFIKTVLNAVNPKDGTDYWLGGLDADRDKGLQWITGQPMAFTDFKVVLQKVPSEANPKVRNHGEGPY